MKIQCSACEAAEANVLCCADEAALCWACDEKAHATNKLVSKHQRILLSSSHTKMPKCDICQETIGFFFCLEDRALFCRKCDLSIHRVNSFVSKHQRFLLTGVKVGTEAVEHGPFPSFGKTESDEKVSEPEFSLPSRTMPVQGGDDGDSSYSMPPIPGGSATESMSPWQLDEFIGLVDFNQDHNFMDSGSSKVLGSLVFYKLADGPGNKLFRFSFYFFSIASSDEIRNRCPTVLTVNPRADVAAANHDSKVNRTG